MVEIPITHTETKPISIEIQLSWTIKAYLYMLDLASSKKPTYECLRLWENI